MFYDDVNHLLYTRAYYKEHNEAMNISEYSKL